MRVGVDWRRRGNDGVSRATTLVLEALASIPRVEIFLLGSGQPSEAPPAVRFARHVPVADEIFSRRYLDTLPDLVGKHGLDAYVGMQFYCISALPCRTVHVLHDSIPFEPNAHLPTMAVLRRRFGQDVIRRYWRDASDVALLPPTLGREETREFYHRLFSAAAINADVVLTVSHTSKRQHGRYVPETRGKTEVMPLFVAEAVAEGKHNLRREPFLLLVGKWDPRKRHRDVILSLVNARSLGAEARLVMVGTKWDLFPTYGEALLDDLERYSNKVVEWRENVPGGDLGRLYSSAMAAVSISDNEGFGLPVLEAMQAGCPVITSGRGAVGEVAGEAALRISHEHLPTSLTEAVLRLESEPHLREDLETRSYERAITFNRASAATVLAEVLAPGGGLTR